VQKTCEEERRWRNEQVDPESEKESEESTAAADRARVIEEQHAGLARKHNLTPEAFEETPEAFEEIREQLQEPPSFEVYVGEMSCIILPTLGPLRAGDRNKKTPATENEREMLMRRACARTFSPRSFLLLEHSLQPTPSPLFLALAPCIPGSNS
jgi:hypothetical protein